MHILTACVLAAAAWLRAGDDKIRVLTTTPELRDIAAQVGGDHVEASSLLKGPEDPHFVDAKPSSIKAANKAQLFIENGMSLEVGYAPLIITESRNSAIQPGAAGFVDASKEIQKREVPTGVVDRSQGDVHPEGNPHYLLDPMNGKVVAREIRDALSAAMPQFSKDFETRAATFSREIDVAVFGEKVLEKMSADTLADLLSQGKLEGYLKDRGALADLGGLAAAMLPFSGRSIVTYHRNLTYFAERFHLDCAATLEPKAGVQPSAAHLETVIATMKAKSVRAVYRSTYQPEKPVEKVCAETGATAVLFPHQVNAIEGADSYIKMLRSIVTLTAGAMQKP